MRGCGIGISFLAAYLLAGGEALCQQPQASEYDLKAAFIYNFAKFTVWPTNAFASATSPLVIGVLGKDPVTLRLKRMLENKKLEGRPLLVTEPESAAEARTN